MNRLQFLKYSLLAYPAISAFASKASLPDKAPEDAVTDEAYWNLVRSQFALTDEITFLNNGTIGVSPFQVIDAMYQKTIAVNTHAIYGGGDHEAIASLARFTGADPEEICFTHNVTEGNNLVAQGLPLKKGDEVIMTTHEHVGGALPWLNRMRHDGIIIRVIPLGATAAETLTRVEEAITKKTRVLAVPHIPCTTGQVLPAKEISSLARSKGIYSFFDGAHGPGMLNMNLHDMGCDFYSSCCHKWMLGPKGTGFLYVRKDKLEEIKPIMIGAYSDTGWDMLSHPPTLSGYAPTAHRFYYGTQSAELYAGIEASVQFHESIGKQLVEDRVKLLSGYLRNKLQALGDGVELVTPAEDVSRGAVTAFRLKNMTMQKFQELAGKERFIIRTVGENNVNCIRISTHIYTLFPEIDRFVEFVSRCV
ncbi:MAG: aminotransferase class V-fold PLP-dependent enzyme [Cyclobacteriaceae bacterium]|nr:aminotransferase class V-fold PLP-dependent enzyme [Cyclobacteriaceae bacterium]